MRLFRKEPTLLAELPAEVSTEVSTEQPRPRAWRTLGRPLVVTILALLYAWFMAAFPFERVFGVGFSDRDNYLWNYTNVYVLMNNHPDTPAWLHYGDSPLYWILHESLFSFSFVKLADVFGSGRAAQQAMTFFSAFVFSRYTLARSSPLLSFPLLFNPLLVDFLVSAERQSVAFAIFLLALPSSSIVIRCAFILISSMVHFSFVLLGLLFTFQDALYKYVFRNLNVIAIGLALLLGVAIYRHVDFRFLQSLYAFGSGDYVLRQGEYAHLVTGSKYTIIWIVYVIVAFLSGKAFLGKPSCFIAVLLISGFVVLQFSSLSGIRLLPIAYPFVLISLQYFSTLKRVVFVYLFSLYILVYWLYWTQNMHWLNT